MKDRISTLFLGLSILFFNTTFSTAQTSAGVWVPEDSIYIESLDRYRKIRIYLPPDYFNSERRYPVLYMHDGQNLFDGATSYAGEWRVDESLDSLFQARNFGMIVVGIDNGGALRMTEYAPWANAQYHDSLGVEGKEYVRFVAKQLKPMIDENYRTLDGAEHTGMMGSSLGGLITHYAVFLYPEVFGKAALFSPSYWFNPEIYEFTQSSTNLKKMKVYVLQGGQESPGMPEKTLLMLSAFKELGIRGKQLRYTYDEGGKHHEAFWSGYFADAVMFLFSDKAYRK